MKDFLAFLGSPGVPALLGNAVYIITSLLAALWLAGGHVRGKINLWELITTTSRTGKSYTDPRKLFELGAWFVTTVTFYYLTVTGHMNEAYALMYLGAWVTARTLRDKAKVDQQKAATP